MTLALVFGATLLIGSAAAAAVKPKPWQWTTTQARAAITAQGEALQPPNDLVGVTCRGLVKATPGRFTSFRCVASLEEGRLVLLAKTRRAGGLCWGVRVVPSACLAPGPRASGNVTEVARAVYTKLGPPAQTFGVMSHGAGFYSWTWSSGGVEHRGTVVFSPSPVLKVLG